METTSKNQPWLDTPKAILLSGLVIGLGLALGLGLGLNGSSSAPAPNNAPDPVELSVSIDADEHIKGNVDAEIILIEYSDYDCPFCTRVHPTLEAVVAESNGEVAWAYRHFPLERIHPEAKGKAVIAECLALEGGSELFWEYTDGLFNGNPIDTSIAAECIENPSKKAVGAVDADIKTAIQNGVSGTPFVIVWNTKTEEGIALSGAQPQAAFEQAINAVK